MSTVGQISNGESGLSVRTKLNLVIDRTTVFDTAANFTSNNPTLNTGQLGIETDDLLTVPKFKIGDGVTAWNTLPYFITTALSSYVKKGTLTNNTILKGSGTDTATDSSITDDGTTVTVNSPAIITSDAGNNQIISIDNLKALVAHDVKILFNSPIYSFANMQANETVETDASKNLVSVAKGTAHNKNFGTTAGTVLEGDRITQTVTNGVTDKVPSEDAVFNMFKYKGSIQNYYSGKHVTIPFAGTSSAINGWNGAIIYIPIPITSSVTFTDISQEVTALVVGSNIRLALYTSVNGLPSALLEDSGNLSTATIGIKNYVLSAPHSFTAVDKQVFVAIQSSSAAVGLRYALNAVCFNYFNGSGQSGGLFLEVQVFGAFPATATPSVYANANSPLVSLLVQ